MKLFFTLVASLLVMPACVASQNAEPQIASPTTPRGVKDILYARPFTLQRPYRNDWSQERQMVSRGVLIVLEVDPTLVVPRDALQPVLYAGDVAVQRLNHGERSGRVIGIVPGDVDLANAPIWFGAPALPERVTQSDVRSERVRAERAGVQPFGSAKIASIERPVVATTDLAALLRDVAAPLVFEYSPQEKELADSWRLPTAQAAPKRNPD